MNGALAGVKMDIIINQIGQKHGNIYIRFECPQGGGEGVRQGEKVEAASNVSVEFEIDELLEIPKNAIPEKGYSIQLKDETTFITGDIISMQDEVVLFRFAETIIQLDCVMGAIDIGDWLTISAKTENLLIYPVNL